MELDKMKQTWKRTSPRLAVNGPEVEAMLRNEAGSAFYKMKRYNFRTTVFCGVYGIFVGLFLIAVYHAKPAYAPLFWVCMVILFLAAGWGIYCQVYLDKMDFGRMDIRTFSRYFLRIRQWEKGEWPVKILAIGAIIWTTIRILVPEIPGAGIGLVVGLLLILLSAAAVGFMIYRRFYWTNLKQVEQALRELEALEKEEDDDDILNLTI